MKKKIKKFAFKSQITSGRSQMCEIILATSLVGAETRSVEVCKFSGEKSSDQHRKPSLRDSDNEFTHDLKFVSDEND